MKKKWIYACILIFCILIIVILAILFNAQNMKNILANEENQVNALYEIYDNFISLTFPEKNIKLDESALKNIITSNLFNQNNQEKLKELERITDDPNLYVLSYNYNEDKKILTLYLKDENGYLHANKEYKLEIKDNTIVYTPSQITQISK